ncbi:hypothetical protein ACT048_04835 [Ectopseudomonas khazarica]|uniref:hypothetical protein n=1 Tax=Ectopseudomonas khazarica TaxID=2502979 RepID=UPI004034B858
MKRIKEFWKRLRAKHWDDDHFLDEGPGFVYLGLNRPPIRSFWEQHKTLIISVSKWLLALVAGAAILRFLGLG